MECVLAHLLHPRSFFHSSGSFFVSRSHPFHSHRRSAVLSNRRLLRSIFELALTLDAPRLTPISNERFLLCFANIPPCIAKMISHSAITVGITPIVTVVAIATIPLVALILITQWIYIIYFRLALSWITFNLSQQIIAI